MHLKAKEFDDTNRFPKEEDVKDLIKEIIENSTGDNSDRILDELFNAMEERYNISSIMNSHFTNLETWKKIVSNKFRSWIQEELDLLGR